ncbi:hypothetical protein ACTQ33_02190 [Candidatus Avoscillospira sp. LCP25S3_F1]|uniref:hypothetical protein n=1 Tax=Candidatus Avoscillospira sp. LCP25S3_F1 TaxID=3438825 RepID=UPI003F8F6010
MPKRFFSRAGPRLPTLRILSSHRAQNGRIVECSVTTWVGNLTQFHIKVDVPHQHIEG